MSKIESNGLTAKQYIENVLIKEIHEIAFGIEHDGKQGINAHPYLAFTLIAMGIEFLGKCLNDMPTWHTADRSMSCSDFKLAIRKISALSTYSEYADILYSGLRCGLCHAQMPCKDVLLTIGEGAIQSQKGIVTIHLTSFYNDFVAACQEVLSKGGKVKDLDKPFITINGSVSGGTETIITKRK